MVAVLFIAAAVAALGDWLAVQRHLFRIEYLLKPATLALLVAAAWTANLYFVSHWVVAALIFGLLGDIGLMLSDDTKDSPDLPFMLGLGSFLIGHVCYIAAFVRLHVDLLHVLAGCLLVAGVALVSLPDVLRGAKRLGGTELAGIVAAYATALSAMAVLAVGTGIVLAGVGGMLFLISDTVIATERFVKPVPQGRLIIIATYHVGQALILLGVIHALS